MAAVDGGGIRVLGPVRCVRADGAVVRLAPRKVELLAVLAAASGTPIERDALAESLWGEVTEATRNRLKTQVAQLRDDLGGLATIDFAAGGYRLGIDRGRLDATRFVDLIRRTGERPESRRASLVEALDLWADALPFVGVDNRLVEGPAWSLVAAREQAVLDLADLVLDGDPSSSPPDSRLVTRLAELHESDPTRGDVATRLARVLDRLGRSATALAVLDVHRRALAAKGMVVSRALVDLERRLLEDPAAPSPSVVEHPHDGPTVDRVELLDRVLTLLESGGVAVVGESGSGKSRLLSALVSAVPTRHRAVVRVDVAELPGQPMEAVIDLLDGLRARDPAMVARHAAVGRRQDALSRLDRRGGSRQAMSRHDLIVELADLCTAVIDDLGAVVVIDDAQWLDRNSAEILAEVIERGGLLVVASRPGGLDRLAPAGDRLSRVDVPPFNPDEVRRYLELALDREIPVELAERVRSRTGGSPLLLRLLSDELGADLDVPSLPATVQLAVSRRTRVVGRRGVEALQRAAIGGLDFDLDALKIMVPGVEGDLAVAVEEGLVRLDRERGTGHFLHGLVVEALVHGVPPGGRVIWHDEWCDALSQVGASALARVDHALRAAELDEERAVRTALEASRELATMMDWSAAATIARRGLAVAVASGLAGGQSGRQLRALVGTMARHAMEPGFDELLLDAAHAAAAADDGPLLAEVVTELCRHGLTTHAGSVDERVTALLDRAVQTDLDPPARAELCAAAAGFFSVSEHWSRGRALYHEAYAWASRSDDEERVARILYGAHSGFGHPDDVVWMRRAADRLLDMDGAEPQGEGHILALHTGLRMADRGVIDRSLAAIAVLEPQVREPIEKAGLLAALVLGATLDGRFADAEAMADSVVERFGRFYPPSWQYATRLALGLPILDATGRLDEVWPLIEALQAAEPHLGLWNALAAWIGATCGTASVASATVDRVLATGIPLFEDFTYTAAVTALARASALLERIDLAEAVGERLVPYSGSMSWNGLSTHGPIDAAVALCHHVCGDTAAARRFQSRALRTWGTVAAPGLVWPELSCPLDSPARIR